jgi:tetratricopeptide (TPR) repeat protein
MNKFIKTPFLLIFCCFAGKVMAQQRFTMPDSATLRKEWLKTIDRTTEDLGLTYNHSSMASILVERADAEARLKRYSKAIDDYNKAIFFDPNLKMVHSRRAHVYEAMANYKAAIGEYEKALADVKGDKLNQAMIWNYIAANQFALGNYEKSVKADSIAIAAIPQFSMAYANKGWANLHMGKLQQAIDDFTESMKGFQSSPQELAAIYRNRGDAYRLHEQYTEAIADYNSALQYVPDFADCYWGLATSYGLTGQFLLAENNFARCANLFKGNNNHELSRLYVDWGGMEDLRRDYAKKIMNDSLAIVYDPKNIDARGALAHAYALDGQVQQSIDRFTDLVRFYQGDRKVLTDIYSAIAEQEYFLGQYDKSVNVINTAITVNPQAFMMYLVRGRDYLKKSNNDMATADFNKILVLDTSKKSSSYAFALFFTGKQDQAVGVMQANLKNADSNLLRLYQYYHLARIYALMNKPDEANSYLKKSIDGGYSKKYARVDPDFDNIRNTPEFKDIVDLK